MSSSHPRHNQQYGNRRNDVHELSTIKLMMNLETVAAEAPVKEEKPEKKTAAKAET